MRIMCGPSINFFPYAYNTGGNTLVLRSVKLKVLLLYHACVSLPSAS